MRGILWGDIPELTKIGAGYVGSQEELDYILDYAWEFSGYKDLYGRYKEPEIEEAKVPTPSAEIIATAMAALLEGQIVNIDGCIRVKNDNHETDYLLVWPPDASVNIKGEQIVIITGLVRGEIEETALQSGDWARISGGETELSEDLAKTIPEHCTGPYWAVGFSIEYIPFPNE